MYAVMLGDKELAVQAFNGGYGQKEFDFGPDVMNALIALDSLIKVSIENLLK